MIKLDTSRMPGRVVAALMARGAQLPPLAWGENPSRTAKSALDEIDNDARLLERETLADAKMAAGVRALLYLWNGWLGDATMHAVVAPEREAAYIEALCKRQAGEHAASKDLFQRIGDHAVFAPLAQYAQETIGASRAPLLKRLREVIQFAETWEPYVFGDVYEQARSELLDVAGDQVVRSLQCYEFELLLGHCLDAATGEKLARYQSDTVRRQEHKRPQARPPVRRPAVESPKPPDKAADGKGDKPEDKKRDVRLIHATDIGVLCPKCSAALTFPETARGATGRCDKCGATFLIPQKQTATSDAGQ